MISKKNTPFSANVQFNADKRYVEFLFDRNTLSQRLPVTPSNNSQEIPRTFRGKTLTDEQYNNYKDGQTVYIDGLKDKQGKEYQEYITYNKETGKTSFAFPNNKVKERLKATAPHATQTAVNSDGKVNESTRHIKEPLKSGQQNPENSKQMYETGDSRKAQCGQRNSPVTGCE